MSFWEQHMPTDMLLRSPWDGSHIADPENRWTLDAFRNVNGNGHLAEPLPLGDFIRYGHWFREHAKLSAERRKVLRIQPAPDGYQLEFEDREQLLARRVVVAAGIQVFELERSEEHTSELQSLRHLVCRLLLEKKKKKQTETQ